MSDSVNEDPILDIRRAGMMPESKVKTGGCDLCGDWPARLTSGCHPTAPLMIEMEEGFVLVVRCYLPECGRELARFKVAMAGEEA